MKVRSVSFRGLSSVFVLMGSTLTLLSGCGEAVQKPPVAPTATPTTEPPKATPTPPSKTEGAWTLPEGPRDQAKEPAAPAFGPVKLDSWTKAAKAKGVAPSPATCAAFAKRAPAATPPKDVAAALAETDPAKRDAALVALEKNEKLPGSMRVLRAELAPTECGDAIVDPILTKGAGVVGYAGHVLIGSSLAAKLARTAANVPTMKDAGDKEKVKKFIQGPLRTWMVEQATAIDELSVPAGELSGHGRALVAMEAGMADLRLVDRIRSAPTPATWDKELKAVYEAALDEALEPRKRRGRDATLVGLADFAADGVVADPRIDRARALLSKLYGGRRIDALDGLLIDTNPSWSEPVDPAKDAGKALLTTGSRSRAKWLGELNVSASTPTTARGRFELGRKYWRRVDFVEAAHGASKEADQRLLLALSLTLAKGAANSAPDMMNATHPSQLGLSHTEALDALVAEGGKNAGLAAYDAALLRALSPPEGGDAANYFADVAARFQKAASLLEDPALKKKAEERAADANASGKAINAPK